MDINQTPLWSAVITPMNEDGSIDFDSLQAVLEAQNDAGNGILILGSTGEALNIDEKEAKEVLEFACRLKRNVPLMCGIGGINLKSTLNWTEYLNTLNIDCYLVVTPLYAKPGDIGQYNWFKSILDCAKKPCMLYNVPSRTGKDMSLSAVEKLSHHQNFWAIKEASGSVEKFEQYVKACGGNQAVYSGDDALLPDFTKVGAKGLVSVAANSWPKATHMYTRMCLDNSLSSEDIEMWKEATESLFVASNPIPVKWLMAHDNQIKCANLRAPLCLDDMCEVDRVKKNHHNIEQWIKKF